MGVGAAQACDSRLYDMLAGKDLDPFATKMRELSLRLNGCIGPLEAGVADRAAQHVSSSLQLWMELYVDHYLDPPPSFRQDPHWRSLMDSVAGPLRAMRTFSRQGKWQRAHDQLELAQECLAEFYDGWEPARAARLGAVLHTLDTLARVHAVDKTSREQIRARLTLLAARIQDWKGRVPANVSGVAGLAPVMQARQRALEAVAAKDDAATLAALKSLVAAGKELKAQAEWAALGLPPRQPSGPASETTTAPQSPAAPAAPPGAAAPAAGAPTREARQ